MIDETGYVLKMTRQESSAQNRIAEKANFDLGRMVCAMLYASGQGSKHWLYAMRHAVYLKNRLPHSSLNYVTPYEKMYGTKPGLSNKKIFDSKVHYKNKEKVMKLDCIDGTGYFMTFKATDKIFFLIDGTTKKECVVTHEVFDEAFMLVPRSQQLPLATALWQAGVTTTPSPAPTLQLQIEQLDKDVKLPKQATSVAVGYDLYSGKDITIELGSQ